ncbi:MAG TPA: hypothetical protein VFE46_10625 [Pirellulales bacterium]|nr:hypothetical protein [Pirellulales bacterium]
MPRNSPLAATASLATSNCASPSQPWRTSWLLLAAALFLFTRGYIFFALDVWYSDAENTYFADSMRAYDGQIAPYSEMLIEYPPLGWWAIYLPRLLAPGNIPEPPTPENIAPVHKEYVPIFRGQMFLCDVASLALLMLTVRRRRPELVGWAALTYTVVTALLGNLIYDRLDMGLLLLLMAWAYCTVRSLDEGRQSVTWSTAAYAMLGLGISYKLIPIVCVPFVALADWRAPRRSVRLPLGLIALIATAGLPFLIQFAISGNGVFNLLKYHSERGIQIESLYSTLMMLASLLGGHVFVEMTHGAFNLAGSFSGLMLVLSNVVLGAFLLGLCLWVFFQPAERSRVSGYRAACLALVDCVILSKVLSPQYFVWAMPMALLLAVEVMPKHRAASWALALCLVAIVALTTWIFPYHYAADPNHPELIALLPPSPKDATNLQLLPCIILGIRNILYFALAVWLFALLIRQAAPPSPAALAIPHRSA